MKLIFSFIVFGFIFIFSYSQDTSIYFSHQAGYYDDSFELTITALESSSEIVYTLDGSNPISSSTSLSAGSPAKIQIDPSSLVGRAATPAVIVRATSKFSGNYGGESRCKTYIFLEKVFRQTAPGGDWPEESYQGVNGHNMDYTMDSSIVDTIVYSSQLESAFMQLPVISLGTPAGSLFNADSGIFTNSSGSGEEWERECSFEIIDSDSTKSVQVNAGLRIKGGWSRQVFNPKYSLRILFKNDYGPGKLKYQLFGEEGAKNFEHIELRTEQNCGWTLDGNIAQYNTFLRDIFARDSQRDMGWEYIRSNYYHLYLNGMYWGIYMTHERINNDFAESYFGGNKEDYDVMKASELVDGNTELWNKLWTFSSTGFEENKDYFNLMGLDENGEGFRGSEVYVDMDNLVDYMLLVFYTGNIDGPVSKWSGNRAGANFIALTDRTDKRFGYNFFAIDFEYSMMVDAFYVCDGINENRVNIGNLSDNNKMYTPNFNDFNPQWLHFKLSVNPEYRIGFIDRAYYLLNENGLLTAEAAAERMAQREMEIDTAIVAESARWGDSQQEDGYAFSQADWREELSSLNDYFFPYRTNIIIQQLLNVGLYSELLPPSFELDGVQLEGDQYLSATSEVSIINPNPAEVFYTLDGSDPREIGGEPSASSFSFAEESFEFPVNESMIIKARARASQQWGPIREMIILKPAALEDYFYLKVTELNYNPVLETVDGESVDGDNFEFIELKNTGDFALNISGLRLDSAIKYTVPPNTILSPSEYYVIARKPKAFFSRYGHTASGNYSGKLANSGEFVLLEDSANNEIFSFTYSDSEPWPTMADGNGVSLVSVENNPTGDPALVDYWKISNGLHGNPFSDSTIIIVPEITSLQSEKTNLFKVFPNPTLGNLTIIMENAPDESVAISIVDISGRIVFADKFYSQLTVNFNELGVQHGIYFLRFESETKTEIIKVVFH